MKRQHYVMIGEVAFILILAIGLFLWMRRAPEQKTQTTEEELVESEVVLRELEEVKADEQRFDEAVRGLTGASYDSLSEEQKLQALVKIADDPEAINRLLAARKLGELETNDPSRVERLIAKLNDEDQWVVEEAALSLTRLGASEAEQPLRRLLAKMQQQPETEYVPFRETAMMTLHGRVASLKGSEDDEQTEFRFELASFSRSPNGTVEQSKDDDQKATFIPADFEYCLRWPNFKQQWQHLQNSSFAKKLTELQAWEDFKAAAPFNRYFKLQEDLDQALGPLGGKINYLIDPLGEEFYLASYGSGKENHFLLVSAADAKSKAVNSVLEAVGVVKSGKVMVKKQTYRGQSIFQITLASQPPLFRYALVDGYLIVSDDQKLLAQSIASYLDADENSLARQAAFRQSAKEINDSSFLVAFVDPKKLFDITTKDGATGSLNTALRNALANITGQAAVDSAGSPSSPAVPDQSPTLEAKTLAFVPSNTNFFYATSTIDPAAMWRYITTQRAEKDAIKQFETRSNLNLSRDLVSKLGNQTFYVLGGIDATGARFFWKHLFGANLKNTRGVEGYCKRLLTYLYSPKERVAEEMHEGVRIYYVNGPTAFEPNFAVVEDYLLMSFELGTMKSAISSGLGKSESITQSARFVEARTRLANPEHAVMYLDPNTFVSEYRNFLTVYERQTNLFDAADIESRIDPLMNLIKATAQVAAGKFSQEGRGEVLFEVKN